MTGGSEGPVTDMLSALARLISGETAEIDRCLQSLRDIDNKGELAYALLFLAERDLRSSDIDVSSRLQPSRTSTPLTAATIPGRSLPMALMARWATPGP